MLDEPTSALDDDNASILLTNLKGFCNLKDITLLVVSHSEELAKKFADEIIHLQNNPKQNN
jgi:ABC-type phosphate/phosphonate transport system ATPase subunit